MKTYILSLLPQLSLWGNCIKFSFGHPLLQFGSSDMFGLW